MDLYLIPKAHCPETGETVKQQDLTGSRFTLKQRALCEDQAQQLADKMTARTKRTWIGYVEEYSPSCRLV